MWRREESMYSVRKKAQRSDGLRCWDKTGKRLESGSTVLKYQRQDKMKSQITQKVWMCVLFFYIKKRLWGDQEDGAWRRGYLTLSSNTAIPMNPHWIPMKIALTKLPLGPRRKLLLETMEALFMIPIAASGVRFSPELQQEIHMFLPTYYSPDPEHPKQGLRKSVALT